MYITIKEHHIAEVLFYNTRLIKIILSDNHGKVNVFILTAGTGRSLYI